MLVVHTLNWNGILLKKEVIDDSKPNMDVLIDYHVDKLREKEKEIKVQEDVIQWNMGEIQLEDKKSELKN